MLHKRRLIAFICLVALLLAALAPAASSPHYAVLAPVDPLFGFVVIAQDVDLEVVLIDPCQFLLLDHTGSRPPPTL